MSDFTLDANELCAPFGRTEIRDERTPTYCEVSDIRVDRPSFLQILPSDLWIIILCLSNIEDIVMFGATCKQSRSLSEERTVWMQQLLALDNYHAPNIPPHIRVENLSAEALRKSVIFAVRGYRNWHNQAGPRPSTVVTLPEYNYDEFEPFSMNRHLDILPSYDPGHLRVITSQIEFRAGLRISITISEPQQPGDLWRYTYFTKPTSPCCTYLSGYEVVRDDAIMFAYALLESSTKRISLTMLSAEPNSSLPLPEDAVTHDPVVSMEVPCTVQQFNNFAWSGRVNTFVDGDFVVIFAPRILVVVNWVTGDVLHLTSPDFPLSSCGLVDGYLICSIVPERNALKACLLVSRLKDLMATARLHSVEDSGPLRDISFPLGEPYAVEIYIDVPVRSCSTESCVAAFKHWIKEQITIFMVISEKVTNETYFLYDVPENHHRCSEITFSTKCDSSESTLTAETLNATVRHSPIFVLHDREDACMHHVTDISRSGRVLVGRLLRDSPSMCTKTDPGTFSFADAMGLQGDVLEMRLMEKISPDVVRSEAIFDCLSGVVISNVQNTGGVIEWFD